ncbi:biopolymer transporter ExbD [Desulfuromonas sp. CSMB_57]|jgi:biopolymer transport protein ExbD|uniref:ExbD/TolR family protein n=1 Tax=Desulfuromonas sp. CSMB_57 TaxID=2807629 RepID=UPI001CD3A89A|nr:biopolymer transporter ExbD [Desulfuromonas sp. CSMB_57]
MAFRKKKFETPRVDLTPMVDCVFLLLIFFLLSTSFVEAPGITVKLPESTAQERQQEVKEVKVYLSTAGEIYVGEKRFDKAQLVSHLRSFGAQAEEMTFLLLADREAQHGKVVELMDLARANGFAKLAIATELPERR